MTAQPDKEEQYILRVQDRRLAEELRKVVREDPGAVQNPDLEIKFSTQGGTDPEARTGEFFFAGEAHPVKRLDLPTVVESFKTYDDINLVKSADIGQIMIVPEKGHELPEGIEAKNGITPPMRDARRRHFRKPRDVDPAFMSHVEEAILMIASGMAPDGYEFIDEEEEYVVSEDGRTGSWQPYVPGRFSANAAATDITRKGKAGTKKAKKQAEPQTTQSQDDAGADDMDGIEEI